MSKFFNSKELEEYSSKIVDMINNFHKGYRDIEVYPKNFPPGTLRNLIPSEPPQNEGSMDDIIKSTKEDILPNLLKWQHPRFFGYFQAVSSHPAVLSQIVSSAVNVVSFQWNSAPASTELECIICDWVVKMLKLPEKFLLSNSGGGALIHSVGEGLFLAVQYAKYRKQKELKIFNDPRVFKFVAYISEYSFFVYRKVFHLKEVYHFRKIPVIYCKDTKSISLDMEFLKEQVKKDIAEGLIPFFYGGTIGSTCCNIDDPVEKISEFCKENNMLYAVDTAYSSTYFVIPEIRKRYHFEGVNVILTNLSKAGLVGGASAQIFVDDKKLYVESITGESTDNMIDYPMYLRNENSSNPSVVDYNSWQVGFGRRFESLKIYYVMKRFGISGYQEYISQIIKLSDYAVKKIQSIPHFDILVHKKYSLITFRIKHYPDNTPFENLEKQNELILKIVDEVNKNGFLFFSKGVILNMSFFRFNIGGYETTFKDIDDSIETIEKFYKIVCQKEKNMNAKF